MDGLNARIGSLVGAGLLWWAAAHAVPRTAALEYGRAAGAEACPDEAALRQAVARRLGRDPFQPGALLRVAVTVEPKGADLVGTIRVVDGASTYERQVASAGRCEDLIPALALGVSLVIEPLADSTDATADQAEATPPPPKRPPPPQPPSPAPRPVRLTPPRRFWGLEAGPQASAGLVPHLGLGLELDLTARQGWLSGAIGCRGVLPSAPARRAEGRVRAELAAIATRLCLNAGPVAACGLGLAGALLGQGSGVERPERGVAPFVAAGLGLRLEVIRGPLTLATSLEGLGLLRHTELMLDDRRVWSTPPFAFTVGTSVGVEL